MIEPRPAASQRDRANDACLQDELAARTGEWPADPLSRLELHGRIIELVIAVGGVGPVLNVAGEAMSGSWHDWSLVYRGGFGARDFGWGSNSLAK